MEDPKCSQFLNSTREEFGVLGVDPEDIDVDIASFHYPVGNCLDDRLLCTMFLRFKQQICTPFISGMPSNIGAGTLDSALHVIRVSGGGLGSSGKGDAVEDPCV